MSYAGRMYAGRIYEGGRGAWLVATAVAFAVAWPLGLAALIYMACSGRLHEVRDDIRALKEDYRARRSEMRRMWRGGGGCGNDRDRRSSTGNAAFDEYRTETLRRLEEEQREFEEYLEKLRAAKDKSEFDAFMAQRRGVVEA